MLVNLGNAVGEIVFLVVNGMREGNLHKVQFRKNFLHRWSHIWIQPVIIIDEKESAANEIGAYVGCLIRSKGEIAMPGHVNKRVVEEIRTAGLYRGMIKVEVGSEILVTELSQVLERVHIIVPIAAAFVFQ